MECKYDSESDMNVAYIELIDTLWNVNKESDDFGTVYNIRINRYIMECK